MEDSEINADSNENFLISKRLKTIRKIGEGSYAKVYLTESTDGENKDNIACKIIHLSKAPREFVTKFLPREVGILPTLNHEYIIRTLNIYYYNNKYFILMPYAENGDLLHYLIKNGKIIENQALEWFRQLLSGLQYLHGMNIAHRDLKCENILITIDNKIKLSDFGFSRYYTSIDSEDLSSTYCGSISYAPPEIIQGIPYDPMIADVWSLGICLYVMLNKSLPFKELNTKRLCKLQMKKSWKMKSNVVGTVSLQCMDILKGMLEPQCDNRLTIEQILCSDWCSVNVDD